MILKDKLKILLYNYSKKYSSKPLATGSNPVGRTNKIKGLRIRA